MRKPIRTKVKSIHSAALSEDEILLFRESVGPVEPVKNDRVHPEKRFPRPHPRGGATPHHFGPERPAGEVGPLASGDIMSFVAPGIQMRVLRRLRAGGFGVDAELDLHGLTAEEARRRLTAQLAVCLLDGCRCVHIIHGKGFRSEGNHPVLKNHVNIWLRQHPDVLAFCSAKPSEGGAGAVYVLLRDARK